jgi:polar amino acid transport system permease protein
MTVPNDPSAPDPALQMGLDLVAHEQHKRAMYLLQVTAVWIVLVMIMTFALSLLHIDPIYAVNKATFILRGAFYTIFVSFVSIIFAAILALFGALGRLSKNPVAQGVSGFYVSVVRGTPLLIQIYLIYLGLPQIGAQLKAYGYSTLGGMLILSALQSGILALSLNYGAYMTEIFRAGIQSIPFGQREAAQAMGMTRWQLMRRVILPQAIRIITPDIGNQFIAMQKDSSLVSVMGLWEITYMANRVARVDSKYMEMFLLAAFMYWVLTIISSWLQGRLEKRMEHAYER